MLVWQAHTAKVRSLAFAPDGRRLVTTADNSRYVWLWDPTSGENTARLTGEYRGPVRSAAFFRGGRHLAADLERREPHGWNIQVWDLGTGAAVANLDTEGGQHYDNAFAVSPDGSKLLACVSAGAAEWDDPTRPTGGEPRPRDRTRPLFHRGATRVAYSPTGAHLCVGEYYMHLHDPVTLKETRVIRDPVGSGPYGASVTAFAFTPDESRLAVATGQRVTVWPLARPEEKRLLIPAHGSAVKAVGFLPGGNHLLTASLDKLVRVWDTDTGAELRSFDWGIGRVRAVAVSPDGTMCAAGSDDGRLVVWDLDL
jgi:WD40 repeat protein